MKAYKISLRINSGILTPFKADTIFGHLCWVVAHKIGEKGLQEFLEPFKQGNPPFVLSDGFPGELLPKPLSADFNVEGAEARKGLRKIDFVLPEDFDLIRNARKFHPSILSPGLDTYLRSHNTISRLTNSALAEGGVYSLKQTFFPRINTNDLS